MRLRIAPRRKAVINVTSLIDVLFLLLIFIMISSTFLEEPGMKLRLPEAKSADIGEAQEYTLYISKEGDLFFNSQPISMDSLESAIKTIVPQLEEGSLALKADEEALHGTVVRVMDIARLAGVKKIIVATKPAKAAR